MRWLSAMALIACDPQGSLPAIDCPSDLALPPVPDLVAPGEVVDLPGEDLFWTATGGTVALVAGVATWTAPELADVDKGETVTLTAIFSEPGCGSLTATADVRVNWTDVQRTLVVYNPAVAGSEEVARYYQDFRAIPEENLCPIASADPSLLDAEQYEQWITAFQACADALAGRIFYVVPVWGVPYQVSGRIYDLAGTGVYWTVSLDALAHLGIDSLAFDFPIFAPLYQEGDSQLATYDPYVKGLRLRRDELIRASFPHVYLVARIDGASAKDALALVDRTAEAEALAASGALTGTVYVDARYGDTPPAFDTWGSYESGDWNMWGTRLLFEDLGLYDVVWDGNEAELGTKPAPVTCPDALYYAGWYSFYNYNDCFDWVPGAIGGHLDSCSACSFRDPGSWAHGALADGITATFGAVNEPYVAGMPEYDQFFLYLTSGATFGEAAYESTVIGLWMMVWIGDPLYRPYPNDDGED